MNECMAQFFWLIVYIYIWDCGSAFMQHRHCRNVSAWCVFVWLTGNGSSQTERKLRTELSHSTVGRDTVCSYVTWARQLRRVALDDDGWRTHSGEIVPTYSYSAAAAAATTLSTVLSCWNEDIHAKSTSHFRTSLKLSSRQKCSLASRGGLVMHEMAVSNPNAASLSVCRKNHCDIYCTAFGTGRTSLLKCLFNSAF